MSETIPIPFSQEMDLLLYQKSSDSQSALSLSFLFALYVGAVRLSALLTQEVECLAGRILQGD